MNFQIESTVLYRCSYIFSNYQEQRKSWGRSTYLSSFLPIRTSPRLIQTKRGFKGTIEILQGFRGKRSHMVEEASDSSHDICIDKSASIKPRGIFNIQAPRLNPYSHSSS